MEVFHDTQICIPTQKPLVVTMGVYDGVHAGHQYILEQLTEYATKIDAQTLLITFYPHPRKVLYPQEKIFLLNTLEERLERLALHNIDYVWVYPFDVPFSNLTATEFVEKIIVSQLHANTVFIGYDHKFGKNREGGYETFRELGEKYNFEVKEIPPYCIDEVNISSTKIRNALMEGDINTANTFLKYAYSLTGKIIKGRQIGRSLGFPTANINLFSDEKLIPKTGVYVSKIKVKNEIYYGVTNIGYKPTLEIHQNTLHIETHIFDFYQDIYGEVIQIYPLSYIREEQKFSSLEELSVRIQKDKNLAMQYIAKLQGNTNIV